MSVVTTVAVIGAVAVLAMNLIPLTKNTASGTGRAHREPSKWRQELAFWAIMLNPVLIVGDLVRGYASFGDTFGRLLMLAFIGTTLWTAGLVIWVATSA